MVLVRTRFAPSPTGEMHIGNLRVAIFNYLFARKHGGAFIVRVEDTDAERNVEGSLLSILDDLRWAGLVWDEGPDIGGPSEPYLQSQRQERYARRAEELLRTGHAYHCFCAEDAGEAETREDRTAAGCGAGCRELTPEEAVARASQHPSSSALRFAVPDTKITVTDYVRGPIAFNSNDISDFIVLRRDGRATYNFAVVVDDADMEITHVIRGAGHLSNTPKQALLFDALGHDRPVFVHLPTVLNKDGGKLSKRTGAPGVSQLRADGFHPQGVVNYLSLLGWSPGDDSEIFSLEELAERLDLEGVGASNTSFDPDKMRWVSSQHIAKMSVDEITVAAGAYLDRSRFPLGDLELRLAIDAIRSRLHTFGEINGALSLLFPSEDVLAAAHGELAGERAEARPVLEAVRASLEALEPWSAEAASAAIREIGQELNVRGPSLFHPVRLALCGDRSGPELAKVIAAVGRERTLGRLAEAIVQLSAA